MTIQDVQAEILAPMQRLYLPPRQMDAQQQGEALKEYARALETFDATELNIAWTTVRDSHTTRGWPVPAAFVLAARQAKSARFRADQAAEAAAITAKVENPEWDAWTRVKNSPLAYEACKLNVAWSLKCAVLHGGKRPEHIDLRVLRQDKGRAERTAERIRRGQPLERNGRNIGIMNDANAAVALSMWRAIAQRETETQNEIARR